MRGGNPNPKHPPRRERCVNGHDLTDPDNIIVRSRKKNGKVYPERQCKPCTYARAKAWRDKNPDYDKTRNRNRDWTGRGKSYG